MFSKKTAIVCAAAAAIGLCGASEVQAAYQQGFETDTSGWVDGGDFGTITRTASGTNGITSAAGSWHAVITEGGADPSGPYTFSGTTNATPWTGPITTSIDVYIDTAQGNVNDGWAWDPEIYDTTGTWLEGGGFGAEKTDTATWSIAPDGDGAAYPGSGGLQITSTGWYRLVSVWGDDAGKLTRDSYIYDLSNNLLYSNELTTSHDITSVGGTNVSWFPNIDVAGGLAIDNATSVPEPSTLALVVGLGGLAMLSRRPRRAKA
jgi:hypothetical protein